MQTTITFADGDQVTSAKLNEIATGLSFTAGDITGTTLSIVGGKLKVGTITASELGANAVTTAKLSDAAVTTAKITDGSVTTAKLANLAITGAKIANNTITVANLSTDLAATQAQMQAQTGGVIMTPDYAKYHPGAAKAYGEFNISGTGRTLKDNSNNCTAVTRVDSTHTTVQLTKNMDSVNYTVMATFVSTGAAELAYCSVYDKAVGTFKIIHPAEAAGRAVNFVVFGKHA